MDFCEALPLACPPNDAEECEIESAYRLVYSDPPTAEDFYSHARKGKKKPANVDDCRWASCSLSTDKNKIKSLKLLPRNRGKEAFVAQLRIEPGSGKHIKNDKNHIDFWMYKNFDPSSAILKVEK